MTGIKLMCLGILCVLVALYLDSNSAAFIRMYLVVAGVILGVVGLFKKDT